MFDDSRWLDDAPEPEHERRDPRRRFVVVGMAAIPWVIVAALLLAPDGAANDGVGSDASTEEAGEVSDPSEAAPDDPADGSLATEGATDDMTPEPSTRSGPTTMADDGPSPVSPRVASESGMVRDALAARATIIARAWLTGVAPHLDVPGLTPADPTSYAEHVVVEAVDQSDPPAAVVTLLAVLLRETPEGLRADIRRVAVPLVIESGQAQPAGEPWWLPSPDLHSVELPSEDQTDPAWFEAAADGLRAAGLEDVQVSALARTDRWPWRAQVRARTPDGEQIDGPVWLRWNGVGFDLAGAVPGGTPHTAPDASEETPDTAEEPTGHPEEMPAGSPEEAPDTSREPADAEVDP